MNVDGSSKGNPGPSGSDDVIKDSFGKILVAFSYFFGERTNMVAECMALMESSCLCQEHGFNHVEVELDSQVLVRMLNSEVATPWKIMEAIAKIQQDNNNGSFQFSHVFREVKVVANALSTLANSTQLHQIFYTIELPKDVVGLAILDMKHTPYIIFCN